MLIDEIAEFRRLHATAGPRSRLTPDEEKRYATLSAWLGERVAAAQRNAAGVREKQRAALRLRRALRVELQWGAELQRALTFDVGTGGFAALLGATPPRNSEILARLHLSGREQITGLARVVGARERRGTARVSFAFVDIEPQARTRLERWLIDNALAEGILEPVCHAG